MSQGWSKVGSCPGLVLEDPTLSPRVPHLGLSWTTLALPRHLREWLLAQVGRLSVEPQGGVWRSVGHPWGLQKDTWNLQRGTPLPGASANNGTVLITE